MYGLLWHYDKTPARLADLAPSDFFLDCTVKVKYWRRFSSDNKVLQPYEKKKIQKKPFLIHNRIQFNGKSFKNMLSTHIFKVQNSWESKLFQRLPHTTFG